MVTVLSADFVCGGAKNEISEKNTFFQLRGV